MASDIRNIFVSFSRHNVLIRQQCKRAGSRGGAGRRSWQACRLTCSLQFPFPLSTAPPLTPPRPLSVVIHFCIHFAHLMPCLLACYPSLYPLSLSLRNSLPLSLSLSLTNCDACVSLLAKKLKALRPVSVCLCPSATLPFSLSFSLCLCPLVTLDWGQHLFGFTLPVCYVSYCSSPSSSSLNLSPTASQLRAIRTSG